MFFSHNITIISLSASKSLQKPPKASKSHPKLGPQKCPAHAAYCAPKLIQRSMKTLQYVSPRLEIQFKSSIPMPITPKNHQTTRTSIFLVFFHVFRDTCERHVQTITSNNLTRLEPLELSSTNLGPIFGLSAPIFRLPWAWITPFDPILADLGCYAGPSGRYLGPI